MDEITVQYSCEDRLGSILQTGNVVMTKDKTYYFLPFWFELDKKSGDYIVHSLESLPEELKETISKKPFRKARQT